MDGNAATLQIDRREARIVRLARGMHLRVQLLSDATLSMEHEEPCVHMHARMIDSDERVLLALPLALMPALHALHRRVVLTAVVVAMRWPLASRAATITVVGG